METEQNSNTTYVMFFIRGIDLDPDEVSKMLGIIPNHQFKRGDKHGSKKQLIRKQGYWSISSSRTIVSSDLEMQIEWLLDKLEPVKSQLISIISKPDVYAQVSCVFNLFTVEWDNLIKPSLLERIVALRIMFGISVYCLEYLECFQNANT